MNLVVSVGVMITMLISESQMISNDPVVETKQGFIAGKSRRLHSGRRIQSFLGIPYAEPPIGDLRFRASVPKEQWTDTLEAFEHGNVCIQVDKNGDLIGDEDCLFLNVYRPQPTSETHLLAVMVYVHGGAFVSGSSNSFKPDYVLDKDLILVTCNYRLGALGFLSTGDSNAPGNFGLKDLRLALRWIQENIRVFGGDPDSVTVAGQSAGAALVHFLIISDNAERHNQKYIIQSGCALSPWAFHFNPEYSNYAVQLAEKNNCPTDDSKSMVDCLRNVNAQQLQSTRIHSESRLLLFLIAMWGPTNEPESEEAILTRSPWELFRDNRPKDKQFIMSSVTGEVVHIILSLFVNERLRRYFYQNQIDDAIKDVVLCFEGREFSDMSSIVERVKELYWHDDTKDYLEHFLDDWITLSTEAQMLFPAHFALRGHLQDTTVPFYFLWFDYRGTFSYSSLMTKSDKNVGAVHSDDMIYLTPHGACDFDMPENLRMSEEDYEILDIMVDMWSSFVINGCPVSKNLNDPNLWKPFSHNNSVLRVGNWSKPIVTLENSFFSERMKLWYDITGEHIFTPISEDP